MLKIDNTTLKARVRDVEDDIKKEKLDAVIVYANGSALGSMSRMHGYMRYLCNFDGHNTPTLLILVPGRAPILLSGIMPFLMQLQTKRMMWFDDVRTVKPPLFGQEVVSIFTEFGIAGQRIGYVGFNETPAPVWQSMQEGLSGAEWVDFAPHLDKRRVEKDDLQLSFPRRAAEICDAIFQTTAREVRTGKKGFQLQAAMEYTARHEGCEYCITWLSVAPRADYPRFYKEECIRAPQEGDQVIPGIYLTYDGHWGHAIRTGTVGKPTDDHRKIHDITREMYEAALERLRPGEDLYEVNVAMDRALHKYYKEDEVGRSRAGHGLGYSYEDPLVSLAFPHPWEAGSKPEGSPNTIEIKPGMLMEIHPNVFVPGVAGAMIGDMVAVTDSGYEVLNEFPPDLISW
jgi:Xaa-Pro aminopeptidase